MFFGVLVKKFCSFAYGFASMIFPVRLPAQFCYLDDVAPKVVQSCRYYGKENFMGRRVPGYDCSRIVCTKKAAQQLKKVADYLDKLGFQLVVYDGYRPQRSVDAFLRWSKDPGDVIAKDRYYPSLDKLRIFDEGYLAARSSHSRGSTFDVTLLKKGQKIAAECSLSNRTLRNFDKIPFLDDGTVDMGSSFDLFHPVSHHSSFDLIDQKCAEMRNLLKGVMEKFGFEPYEEEWWHYTLKDEPFPDTYFDFVVVPQRYFRRMVDSP